jgi:hypothetical protein
MIFRIALIICAKNRITRNLNFATCKLINFNKLPSLGRGLVPAFIRREIS